MTYVVEFDPTKATLRYTRGARELAVQRFDAKRWVAFEHGQCIGTGPTREAAVAHALRRTATAAEVLAQQTAQLTAAPPPVEAVQLTPDIRRLFNLPTAREVLGVAPTDAGWRPLLGAFSHPPVALRPFQAWTLFHACAMRDAHLHGKGLLVSAGVGQGKTLIGLLLGTALRVPPARVLTLVPAALEPQWLADVKRYRDMGFTFPTPIIRSHETLGAGIDNPLVTLNPSLVIVDEASAFANGESNRTRRLAKWKAANPNARLVLLSATFFKSSLTDVADLGAMVLDELSPFPRPHPDIRAVASAVDADSRLKRYAPGVLLLHVPEPMRSDRTVPDVTKARAAVRSIMAERTGYLTVPPDMAPEGETSAPLTYAAWRPPVPERVAKALDTLQRTWVHPCTGDEYTTALDLHRAASELSAGYYSQWVPPPPEEWALARKAAARVIRCAVKTLRAAGLPDSPGMWAKALKRNARSLPARIEVEVPGPDGLPERVDLREVWRAWESAATRHGTTLALAGAFPGAHRIVTRWDPYLANAAASWGVRGGGLIWTRSPDFGQWVASVVGCAYYGRVADGGDAVRTAAPSRPCVLSVQVHHRGKNLQAFNRNLILQPFGSADVLEQTVGRTHRQGQTRPVSVDLCMATVHQERSVAAALRRARFVAEIGEAEHRLWRFGQHVEFDRGVLDDPGLLRELEDEEP